jgi:hypothetical protein
MQKREREAFFAPQCLCILTRWRREITTRSQVLSLCVCQGARPFSVALREASDFTFSSTFVTRYSGSTGTSGSRIPTMYCHQSSKP